MDVIPLVATQHSNMEGEFTPRTALKTSVEEPVLAQIQDS